MVTTGKHGCEICTITDGYDEEKASQKGNTAAARYKQGFERTFARCFVFEFVADQQKGGNARPFPEQEEGDEVARHNHAKHGKHEQQGIGMKAGFDAIFFGRVRIVKIIAGVDDKLGSLEVGKAATVVVSEGDILDYRSSKISQMWIDGRAVDLDNKQKQLHEKYQQRYSR